MNLPPATSDRFWPLSRRQGLWALMGLGLAALVPARAAELELPLSESLPDEVARAVKAGQPLVVMVSLHRCPWCEMVRNNYLAPMRAREGLQVVQVDMLGPHMTRAPDGEELTHDELVRQWGVTMAPTLLFLGRDGQELADRLVGGSPDFYSAYLDGRLERARKALTA